ncbi:MAG: metallophosphoesterase [Clostridiales Family XIII bacterium]|jgi:predicted phosphohydrolase|nr:metallophosphoesterase [Clostridiales Family XIII bacterium]
MSDRIFAIGDLHLSFSQEKPMGVFGENWEDHHLKIEENWRASVADDDIVFIPGDISWALKLEDALSDLAWLHALPGTKVLLRGNHDYWWNSVSKLRELYDSLRFIQNDSMDVGNAVLCGTRGWLTPEDVHYNAEDDEKIFKRELIRLRISLESAARTAIAKIAKDGSGETTGETVVPIICGLHFPPTGGGSMSEFTTMFEEFGVTKVVYGHLHGKESYGKGIKGVYGGVSYSLVSADYIDFNPIQIL